MIIVNIDSTCVRCGGIWQYDYGQILRIQNLKLPPAVEIHFSLKERGGQSITRVGTTKDGVTDVVIPDSMLENGDITTDYKIYAFIYLTDSESGQTEYKISMSVKSRPRPESFERQEDAELFRTAIAEVNKSATSAQESATKSATAKDESIAASKEAKQSAEAASVSAQASKNSADASKGSEKTASSAATEAVNAKDIAVKAADSAYNSALASSRSAKEAQTNAEQADTAAKSAAQSKQDIHELKTVINSTAEQIATDRTAVETDKKEVQKAKSDVEDLKSAVEQKSSEALVDLENTEVVIKKNIIDLKDVVIKKGNEAISGIETARDNAINDVNNAKDTAVNTIAQEEESAVNAVDDAKDNAVAEINKNENVQQIKQNKEDIAEAKTDIEELKDKKITKFYANNLGETHLEDSDSGKIQDMFLYGKSEQKQYTGKNLSNGVNNGLWISSGATTCGISDTDIGLYIDVSELSYVTVSTRNVQKRYRVGNINTLPTKEVPNVNCYNGTQMDGLNKSYTLDTTGYKYLVVNATNLEDIQIEIGTEATEYEQYVGGIPSPNIEYPQEIKSVVNPAIKICGKNLLNLQRMIPFYTSKYLGKINILSETVIEAEKITNSANSRFYAATLNLPNGNYVASVKQNSAYNSLNISQYPKKPSEISQRIGTSSTYGKAVAFSVTDDYDYVLEIRTGSATENPGNGNGKTIFTVQIEKGSSATDYDPYKRNTAVLPYTLNAIPVSSDGNITIDGQQYIADYVDVERGKLVRNVREVDFSTCTREKNYYNILDNSKEVRYSYNNLKIKQQKKGAIYNNGGGFINAFTLITSTTWDKDQIGISSHAQGNNNMLSIRIPVEKELNDLFDEIGGCKGLFEIDTPEEIDLTQEEIKAFKELATYYPVTNVSITSDQLDGYTTFNYPVSMKNGWDYVKQQLNDNRDYIYDMDAKTQDIDTQSAEAYVNSEYAVALTELEVM